jgi:hypothetical protein
VLPPPSPVSVSLEAEVRAVPSLVQVRVPATTARFWLFVSTQGQGTSLTCSPEGACSSLAQPIVVGPVDDPGLAWETDVVMPDVPQVWTQVITEDGALLTHPIQTFQLVDPYTVDRDGDRLTDGEEYFGTTDLRDPDTDDDGLRDNEGRRFGTDPNDPDSDGGGRLDGEEVALGTDPLDPADDAVGEQCANNTDDDLDGLVDCEDADCFTDAACVELDCADGADGDGDGRVDCEDEDCWDQGCETYLVQVTAGSYTRVFDGIAGRDALDRPSYFNLEQTLRATQVEGVLTLSSTTCTWTADTLTFEQRLQGDTLAELVPTSDRVVSNNVAVSPGCPVTGGFLPSDIVWRTLQPGTPGPVPTLPGAIDPDTPGWLRLRPTGVLPVPVPVPGTASYEAVFRMDWSSQGALRPGTPLERPR